MTGSRRLAEARPVRSPDNSVFRTETAPCMRRLEIVEIKPSAPSLSSQIRRPGVPVSRRKPACRPPPPPRSAPRRPASWTLNTIIGSPLSRASAKAAVSMTARPLRDRLLVGHVVVADGLRIAARIGRIDAVDLRPLQQRVAFQLERAERRAAVGGEEGIAGAAGEHDDAPSCSCARRRGGARRSRRSTASRSPRARAPPCPAATSAASSASAFMTVASMPMWSPVTRSPPLRGDRHAAEEVAAADDDGDLGAGAGDAGDLRGEAGQRRVVDAEGQIPQQRLARKLEQDPLGLGPRGHGRPRTFRR